MKIENVDTVGIGRAHRLGPRGSATPVVVKFATYKQSNDVWKARTNLVNTKYFISEHFPEEIETRRRDFYPLMPFLGRHFNRVFLVKDVLVCDDKQYLVDSIEGLIVSIDDDPGSKFDGNVYIFLSEYSPLSNFYSSQFKFQGQVFSCAEQAYQHAKSSVYR